MTSRHSAAEKSNDMLAQFSPYKIQKSTHLHQPFWLSKTRVFERDRRDRQFLKENGLVVSQNSSGISAFRKVYARLNLENTVQCKIETVSRRTRRPARPLCLWLGEFHHRRRRVLLML